MDVESTASYTKKGKYLRIYEINPAVQSVAETQFNYLADALALINVIFGDAYLSLQPETLQTSDIFVLDAFSSDANQCSQ